MSGAAPPPGAPPFVAHELVPTVSEAFKTPPERPKACEACRGYHGGVNALILCLERALRIERGHVTRLREIVNKGAP